MLPLSIPGAVSMAAVPDYDLPGSYLSSDSFFIYKFSKQVGGAGGGELGQACGACHSANWLWSQAAVGNNSSTKEAFSSPQAV